MKTKELAKIYKALSNENRLEIFLTILKNSEEKFETGCDCAISEMIGNLCIGAPTVSHHLKELSNAGLIETERNGKFLTARVNRSLLEELQNAFNTNLK